jgi:hypothetical protein
MEIDRRAVLVVGAGPAGLAAAEAVALAGLPVQVVDRMPSVGRKLLIAGRGGLNLTHAEAFDAFVQRYSTSAAWLQPMLSAFGPAELRQWAAERGIDTFVGSSGRVFPSHLKASPLLRAWLQYLADLGVTIATRVSWTGFDSTDRVLLDAQPVEPAATILACGGASWPRLGSDGAWARHVPTVPFTPSNAGVEIAWSPVLKGDAATPLKPLGVSIGGVSSRGEAVLTASGLEGGAVYALSAAIRQHLAAGQAVLSLDLLPDHTVDDLVLAWQRTPPRDSMANRLRKAWGIDGVKARLLREPGALPADPAALAERAKAVPLPILGFRPIAEAISSAGGVPRAALDDWLMLVDRPGVFCCGEMLDWDAPTGGYLLTACWSTGRWAGRHAAHWVKTR